MILQPTPRTYGITRIELIVLMLIIGGLVSLIIPGIVYSRSASRQISCQDNLRVIGMAVKKHEDATGRFPTGGWTFVWVGDPDRGNNKDQPGGWIYNLLPYVGESLVHDMGAGLDGQPKRIALGKMQTVPIAVFNCPDRRDGGPYRHIWGGGTRNAAAVNVMARADYAANGGDVYLNKPGEHHVGPRDLRHANSYTWKDTSKATGVCFLRSEIRLNDVLDGTNNTYLVGEKYLDADKYRNGEDMGDDWSMYQGDDVDTIRWATGWIVSDPVVRSPLRDQPGKDADHMFGSSHPKT